MIEQNLGNIERVLRLVAGILLAGWTVSQHNLNGVEWFTVIVSLFLILNGVFGRCYLWFVLDINTRTPCLSAKNCLHTRRAA